MTSGNQSGNKFRNQILTAFVIFCFFSCETGRDQEIKNGVYFLRDNEAVINKVIIPFSRQNAKGDIVVIYFDKSIPTVIPSASLREEMGIDNDFISFDLDGNNKLTKDLITRFPLIVNVIRAGKELEIDVLSARNDSINLSLKGSESFLRNFDYKGGYGLRDRAEMLRLYKDPKSRYWLFQVDSNWIIINDP